VTAVASTGRVDESSRIESVVLRSERLIDTATGLVSACEAVCSELLTLYEVSRTRATPAKADLFEIDFSSPELGKESFHSKVA
jgi:hypothetical protein